MNSRRGWSAERFGLEMGVCVGMASGRGDSHRLDGQLVFKTVADKSGQAVIYATGQKMIELTILSSYAWSELRPEKRLLMEIVVVWLKSCELLKLQAERDAHKLASVATTSAAGAAVL